jgi:hypothetical protein
MKNRRQKHSIEMVALHEAGHAVIALAVGYIVIAVRVDEKEGVGSTDTVWPGKHEDPLCAGIMAWAGAAAEGVDYLDEDGDHRPIRRFRFSPRSVATLKNFAEQYVALHRAAIEAVATEIVRRREVCGATIKRIAFRACPELRREAVPTPRKLVAHLKSNLLTNKRFSV